MMKCKCWDLRFLAPSREVATFHSSLGGECGERVDSVKDARSSRRGDCSATPLTEPDMRGRIRLFGSICQNSSDSWARTRGRLRSFHKALSEAIRPSNQDGG